MRKILARALMYTTHTHTYTHPHAYTHTYMHTQSPNTYIEYKVQDLIIQTYVVNSKLEKILGSASNNNTHMKL